MKPRESPPSWRAFASACSREDAAASSTVRIEDQSAEETSSSRVMASTSSSIRSRPVSDGVTIVTSRRCRGGLHVQESNSTGGLGGSSFSA